MIEIIRKRERTVMDVYELLFQDKEDPSRGFWFPCDECGRVSEADMEEHQQENYRKCREGMHNVCEPVVQHYVHEDVEPALGRCHCGHEVELSAFTNTCEECGRDYNSFGQELAPRECWGEETGESYLDVLEAGHHIS